MLFKFECATHQEYGSKGWLPSWIKNADPLPGLGVAHDIMEHASKDDGSISAEFRAFGAMLYTRHEGGYWAGHRYSHWFEHAYVEIYDLLFRHPKGDVWNLAYIPKTRPLDEETEYQFDETFIALRKMIRDEGDGFVLTDRHTLGLRACFRQGYRAARVRFHNACPCDLAHLFKTIERETDRALNDATEGVEQLVVYLNFTTLRMTIDLRDPYEQEFYV